MQLAQLSALRGLSVSIGRHTRVPATDDELERLHWPELEALSFHINDHVDTSRERFLNKVLGAQTTLRALHVQPSKYDDFQFDLASLCGLVEMQILQLADMNIHYVPDCFSRFTNLRYLYLPCNYLTEAPKALTGLPELVAVVAFRQGEYTPCHLKSRGNHQVPRDLRDRQVLQQTYGTCKSIWESKAGLDRPFRPGGGDNARVICPWVAIRGSIKDWLDLGWPKIQKLWLDGNFISGKLPEDLPTVWPHMQSLDLYNNELEGSIPASWAALRWDKLQLHDNHLSGPVPPELFGTRCCWFNIAWNRNLSGCVPPGTMKQPKLRGLVGTQLQICSPSDSGLTDRRAEEL